MSNWEALLLVLLIVGIIASNLVVLKHTAKFKMHQFGDNKDKSIKSKKKDDEDSAKSPYPKYKEWDDDK